MLQIKQTPGQRAAKHGKKFQPLVRALRNIAITVVVLGGVLGVAAYGYTWYNSTYGEGPKTIATIKRPAKPKAPTKPSPTGKVGVSVQTISSPIAPGENASITVRTNADANCTIKVEYNKVAAKDSGLMPQKANEFGMATWSWTVPMTAPVGKWPVTVACANLKNSGVVIGDLEVSKSIPKPAVVN
jgi:hypothetical protein